MEYRLKPEDWKFCALIEAQLDHIDDDVINFNGHAIRFLKPKQKLLSSFFIAEVFSLKSQYTDAISTLHGSLDILSKVLARISIATFRNLKIIAPLSVVQYEVKRNVPFSILVTTNFRDEMISKSFNISNNLKLFDDYSNQQINDSINEINLAINSKSIFVKFFHYYNSIERIADSLTTEHLVNKCNKCGDTSKSPLKATTKTMRNLFEENGLDNKVFQACKLIRSKLAHGSAERNRIFTNQVLEVLPKIESIAFSILQKHSNLSVLNGEIVINSYSNFIEIEAVKNFIFFKPVFRVKSLKLQNTFSFQKIGKIESNREGFIDFPVFPDLTVLKKIPYVWPY